MHLFDQYITNGSKIEQLFYQIIPNSTQINKIYIKQREGYKRREDQNQYPLKRRKSKTLHSKFISTKTMA
jgi:hypothetical protein